MIREQMVAETTTETATKAHTALFGGWERPPWLRAALVALLGVVVVLALAPVQPGVTTTLAAAARERAFYRYDRALMFDAQAHAEDPTDPRPLCDAGATLMLQHESAAAATAYQACATLAPGDAASWLALGDARAASGDDHGALAAWQKAAHLGAAGAWARIAERDERLGLIDEATSAWAQAPQTEEAQANLGLLALARGDTTAAQGHFARLEKSSSKLATQLHDLGVFLFAQRAPEVSLDWEGIGHALLALGKPALALEPLRRAVALDNANGSAHAYYGWTLWVLGRQSAARPEIAAGLAHPPTLPFAYYAAGQVALADGRNAQALADFQNGLQVDGKNPVLWLAAGDAATAARDYTTAELSYQNAALYSKAPDDTVALIRFYLNHGIGLTDGQALQTVHTGLLRFPTSEPLAFLQGLIYAAQGYTAYAAGSFQLALQLDPTDPGPWLYLGRYAANSGDTAPAIIDLDTALALAPHGPYAAQARSALARLPATSL